MAEEQIHKKSSQEIMRNNIVIKSERERQKIVDQGQRIKKANLHRGQERIATVNIRVPERPMARFDLLDH
ncbi:hypothetical protein A3K48_07195 [candidate division WOR-1 bacterium RIFOXYA12_FULL_52_29]|uniref:Uncharacterized protein n=1 Tax=candidate division WOR-1 bacterium RIFOXYC12_FULL_54_18 TaxID=1802584 RepID=A0A1F4T857_UNCSA|nr:MAG: hypothetical protein A3K44_07195 [candidate division WOR-1 bacterium RIFOXYA2_FULL_51_19]OGC18303.1 MAG: hypothetical protein A3K48_07195 [candidate division WOR-1 bacterium RIFOXYA12_FULL_52_29]OGC27158.1 MAG: hypothetical protein A3K32_07190 [candidate division WOR-1 bacterium RIFOXYB2_FULL_45_9]OGC28720.1 MAG: hypothetical protein A3K49_07195 [candidate division WOR-1 bacterium RIFOXYC12_FULL_54_18]OGC30825.1 MAG: hypothetical protein A2346_05425 [candidate division WOR-1 bacterium R